MLALSMFMGQVLSEDGSCQKAVDGWAAQRAAEGLSVQSVNTGAYCKARQRLPVEMVSKLVRYTARQFSGSARRGWRWRGRWVKLVDGTWILMPDTAANQACYPQLTGQAVGVGSSLARLVGVICLSTRVLIDPGGDRTVRRLVDADDPAVGSALWFAHSVMPSNHQDVSDRQTAYRRAPRQQLRYATSSCVARAWLADRMSAWPERYRSNCWVNTHP